MDIKNINKKSRKKPTLLKKVNKNTIKKKKNKKIMDGERRLKSAVLACKFFTFVNLLGFVKSN